ncbi:MAG: hypothetical protein AB8G99_08605 [Planctomycetaceae bacterium]
MIKDLARIANSAVQSLKLTARSPRARRRMAGAAAEPLEVRTLLAGNVLATLDGNDLTLVGDNDHSFFEVVPGLAGVIVRGVDHPSHGSTSINGQSAVPFPTFDINNLTATLRGGSDLIDVRVPIGGDVKIKLGAGFGAMFLSMSVEGDVIAKGGSSQDAFIFEGDSIGGNVTVNTGANVDGSGFEEVGLRSVRVSGKTKIKGGRGKQAVTVTSSRFDEDFSVALGGGNDLVRLYEPSGASNVFFGSFKANGGGGVDSFTNEGSFLKTKGFEEFF